MKKSNTKNFSDIDEKLRDYDGEDQVISSHDMAKALLEEERPIEIQSGFQTIDDFTGGFRGGELTVISGLTGNGKTLFAQTLTRNFADHGIKSLWFSYEVMPANFLKAFGEDLPIFYMPARLTENALTWISTRISEAIQKYEIKAVFVDHLHFIVELNQNINLSIEIGALVRAIAKMAKKFNIVFFLIAHPTKVSPEKELCIGDIRDSSFVTQEADNVFLLWRLLSKENQAILKIAKNCLNGVFDKKIKLHKVGSFLEEVPHSQN